MNVYYIFTIFFWRHTYFIDMLQYGLFSIKLQTVKIFIKKSTYKNKNKLLNNNNP